MKINKFRYFIEKDINIFMSNFKLTFNSSLPNIDELTPVTFTCVNSSSPVSVKLSISG